VKYSIDTSSLLDGWVRYYPPDVFPSFWKHLEGMIGAGELISPDEVLRELAKKEGDTLHSWACPRWTSENRPYVDTSKPANGAEPEQEYLYPAVGHSGNCFFESDSGRVYTKLTWAEGTATQGCDRSDDPAAGMAGRRKPPFLATFWRKGGKSQGFGDRVPK
jgi:hypothetical protein